MLSLVSTAAILLFVRMLQSGVTWKNQALLAACIALGFLTKPTFAALIPVWILAIVMADLRRRVSRRTALAHGAYAASLLAAAALFYGRFGMQHLELFSRAMEAGGPHGSQTFPQYLFISLCNLIRPWSLMGKRLITSYWANFGWKDTAFEGYGIYLLAHGLSIAAAAHVAWRSFRSPSRWYSGGSGVILFALVASVLFFLGILVMGYTIAHDAWESGNLQGRYFFPVLSLHMAVIAAGFVHYAKREAIRRAIAAGLAGSLLLWHLASYLLVFERYYF